MSILTFAYQGYFFWPTKEFVSGIVSAETPGPGLLNCLLLGLKCRTRTQFCDFYRDIHE